MERTLQYLKSNALVIALLGAVGYQQWMLTELMEYAHWNSLIRDNNAQLFSDQLDEIEMELMLTKIGVDALQYQ